MATAVLLIKMIVFSHPLSVSEGVCVHVCVVGRGREGVGGRGGNQVKNIVMKNTKTIVTQYAHTQILACIHTHSIKQ